MDNKKKQKKENKSKEKWSKIKSGINNNYR